MPKVTVCKLQIYCLQTKKLLFFKLESYCRYTNYKSGSFTGIVVAQVIKFSRKSPNAQLDDIEIFCISLARSKQAFNGLAYDKCANWQSFMPSLKPYILFHKALVKAT